MPESDATCTITTKIPELNGRLAAAYEQLPGTGYGLLVGSLFIEYVKDEASAWFEDDAYRDSEHMESVMADRAANEDDPNPLPTFYVDLNDDEPTINILIYNPVSGVSDEDTGVELDGLTLAQFREVHEDYGLA